jgi:hypothetical protein
MNTTKVLLTAGSMIGVGRAIRSLRNLDLNDALGVVGLQRRAGWTERLGSSVAIAAVSAAIGAGVALLLAPYPGEEMRKRVTGKAKELKEKTNRKASEAQQWVAEAPIHNS